MQRSAAASARVLSIPAPYGRACEECARSKCRCMLRHEGGRCERYVTCTSEIGTLGLESPMPTNFRRCQRLDRACRPSATRRHATAVRPGTSKKSRTAESANQTLELQRKLDELLALLKPDDIARSRHLSNATRSPGIPSPNSQPDYADDMSRSSGGVPRLSATDIPSVSSWASNLYDIVESSVEEDEANLTAFKTCKTKFLPILYLPPALTVQQLRVERPFLWLCIMAVTSRSTAQQRLLSVKVKQTIAHDFVVKSERSLDALQGLLVFIGW